LKQMGGEGMPERVATCMLGNTSSSDGFFDSFLQNSRIDMMPTPNSCAWIY